MGRYIAGVCNRGVRVQSRLTFFLYCMACQHPAKKVSTQRHGQPPSMDIYCYKAYWAHFMVICILFIVIGILLFFIVYFIPACSKEIIHLTLDHLSAWRNNILDHLSAGRKDIVGHLGAGKNEKYVGFPDPLTITRMLLLFTPSGWCRFSLANVR